MEILRLETYKQTTGSKITIRKVRMVWAALTNLCVERLVGGVVQEGWYGWEEDTLKRAWDEWVQFEQKIGSLILQ